MAQIFRLISWDEEFEIIVFFFLFFLDKYHLWLYNVLVFI